MIPSRTVSANCPTLPRVIWPNIVVSALPLFPLTLFPGPILLILNHLYGVLAMTFGMEKLEWCGYPMVQSF